MKTLLIAATVTVLYFAFINAGINSEKERFETLVEKSLALK